MSQNNVPKTNLDANQVLKNSYMEAIDAIRVSQVAGSLPFVYNYVSLALSVGNTVETYTFRDGGAGGTIVGTVVITYTDSTRELMLNALITAV